MPRKAISVKGHRMNNEALVTAPTSKSDTSPHNIAESILGEIDWESPDRGSCTCPGVALHSSRTDGGRCAIFMDGAPTVHCFHSSCNEEVNRVNFRIRSALGKARCSEKPYVPTVAEQLARAQRWREKKRSEQLIAKVIRGWLGSGRPWRRQYAQQGQNDYRVAHSIPSKHRITIPTI